MQEERSWEVVQNFGKKMFGVLHKPVGVERGPGVLVCHGFGGNKIGSHRLFVHLAEKLVGLGFTVLRVDLRGSGDSEGDFKEMTLEGEVSDLMQWLHLLERKCSAIGLLGVSLGGAVALLAAEQYRKVNSLALWAPVASAHQWQADWAHVADGPYIVHKGKVTSRQFFEQFFAMDLKKTLQILSEVPLFHAHGGQDEVVHLSHQELYRHWRLESPAKSHFVTLPASDHTFSHLEEQEALMQATTNWFRGTL